LGHFQAANLLKLRSRWQTALPLAIARMMAWRVAAPVYRALWWNEQDRLNRQRIAGAGLVKQ
jgi:hypothetical protein